MRSDSSTRKLQLGQLVAAHVQVRQAAHQPNLGRQRLQLAAAEHQRRQIHHLAQVGRKGLDHVLRHVQLPQRLE
jgi:hypothetical protein